MVAPTKARSFRILDPLSPCPTRAWRAKWAPKWSGYSIYHYERGLVDTLYDTSLRPSAVFPTAQLDLRAPTHANAEVLLWQGRVRIGLALAAGGVAFILQQTGVLRDSGPWLFLVIAGYMTIIGLIGWRL